MKCNILYSTRVYTSTKLQRKRKEKKKELVGYFQRVKSSQRDDQMRRFATWDEMSWC